MQPAQHHDRLVTDYTYDATHGGLLTVTQAAPTSGAVRPQTRLTYSALYAWYKNSGGTVVQAPAPVYRPTASSACVTGSSCAGTSDEVKGAVTYGTPGVANNLLSTATSSGSGDGLLTATTAMTYDAVGNALTIDGPLAGSTDTIRYRYDLARRPIGVIGPDPDGVGALKHRGTRTSYGVDGQVTSVEAIVVSSQSDGDWASPTVLQQQVTTYDSLGRATASSLVTGGVTQAIAQYTYDAANRLDCTATRMNPSVFGSLPSSACTLGTTGANGPDRISKTTYNAADEVVKITSAYGTLNQTDDLTRTYNNWGLVATEADALGGLTTHEYDGFGRPKKIRYPIVSSRTVSSSTDYEEFSYDAYGDPVQHRRRDGQLSGVVFDKLRRTSIVDAPSGMSDVTYTYDNLGRVLSTATSGQTLTFAWDGLGRQISATGPLGTISYQYDLAGRRTRMTWPDSFYVTYDHDSANALTAIREYGAASGVGVLATFAYDDLGRRASLTRGNGVVTSYTFDTASRLTSLAHDLSGTTHDQIYSFTYNAAFQTLTRTASNGAYAWPMPANGTQNYTANGLNQLVTSGPLTLSYDGRGNLASDGVNSYDYDAANRLTGMSGATIAYDPASRLYETAGSATTRFAYDGVELIAEYNASGTLLRRYVHGLGIDEPLVWYEGGDRRWLIADQQGSIIGLANSVASGWQAILMTNTACRTPAISGASPILVRRGFRRWGCSTTKRGPTRLPWGGFCSPIRSVTALG